MTINGNSAKHACKKGTPWRFSSLSNLWVGFWNIPNDCATNTWTIEELTNTKFSIKTRKYLKGKFFQGEFFFFNSRVTRLVEPVKKSKNYAFLQISGFFIAFEAAAGSNSRSSNHSRWSPCYVELTHFCTLFSLLWTFSCFHPTFLKWKLCGGVNETMIFVCYCAYLDEWLEFSL